MVTSITDVMITAFADSVHEVAQQKQTRLSPYAESILVDAEDFAYDSLGTVEARRVTGRYSPIVFNDIEHGRRQLKPEYFEVVLPIDDKDVEQVLTDPEGRYVQAMVSAMNRRRDKIIYDALFASIKTGRNFGTTVTAATDGVVTVDATGGVTYEKLLELSENFIDNEVSAGDGVTPNIILGISGQEHTKLMGEMELISGDYSKQFAIDAGRISTALGMKVMLFGDNSSLPIIDVTGGTADCFAMAIGGVAVGINKNMEIDIKDRPDLSKTKQVQIGMYLGAVRTEGKLVQKFQTTRT